MDEKNVLLTEAAALILLIFLLLDISASDACSFLVTNANTSHSLLRQANYKSQFRGPDATNIVHDRGWSFLHNLLSITGQFQLQPFVSQDESLYAVVNGEIYNYRELETELKEENERDSAYTSDGFAILPAYKKWGAENFVSNLHGEFALVVVDFSKEIIVLSPDVFATKPISYATWPCSRSGPNEASNTCFAAASYESALTGIGAPKRFRKKLKANEVLILSLKTKKILSRHPVFQFDLRQHKTSTIDYQKAFVKAVEIRSKGMNENHKIFVGVSSGYDSGSIMLALELLGRPFLGYYIPNEGNNKSGNEDESVVQSRVDYLDHMEGTRIQLSRRDYDLQKQFLSDRCESTYTPRGNKIGPQVGISYIISEARKRKGMIFLSGVGVDEIISLYSMNGRPIPWYQSVACKNSKFPDDLEGFFPWCSFYGQSMLKQIAAVELTGGAHGIEARYPFLDPFVVQEFLWLTANVKNSEYKRPLADFLRTYDFPNMWNQKAPMPYFFPKHHADETSAVAFKRHSRASSNEHAKVIVNDEEQTAALIQYGQLWIVCAAGCMLILLKRARLAMPRSSTLSSYAFCTTEMVQWF